MQGITAAQLLGRTEQVEHSPAARALVEGRTALVTGAGGSIGSELVRQLLALGAGRVVMVDHDENALHGLQLDVLGHGLLDDPDVVLADIRELPALRRVFQDARPELVFHAAAHKHLPLLERFPGEAVKTNVVGTSHVVDLAQDHGAELLVNVSTDKAAAPTSVLGATKRLAEQLVAGSAAHGRARLASVRFGNVLGSRGSFLRSLCWQVDHGVPVTITDPAVTRYFMTIPEAAGLVVEAAVMASHGETYVLDMGEPVRILDLVDRYAHLVGASPELVFTGLRPGEKLHEVLLDSSESQSPTRHPRITCVRPDATALPVAVPRWRRLADDLAPEELRAHLLPDTPTGPLVPVQRAGDQLVLS